MRRIQANGFFFTNKAHDSYRLSNPEKPLEGFAGGILMSGPRIDTGDPGQSTPPEPVDVSAPPRPAASRR